MQSFTSCLGSRILLILRTKFTSTARQKQHGKEATRACTSWAAQTYPWIIMYMQSASHVHIIMSSIFGVRIWVRRWISCSSAHGAFNFSPAVFGHLITPTTCKMPPNRIRSRSRTFWRLSTPRPEMATPRGPECQQRKQHELRCKHYSNSKLKIRTSKQSIHN